MTVPTSLLAQTILQSCKAHGVEDIIISPGSRNAPLTLGFTGDSSFRTMSIVDERCAAFFALGIAQQKKKPVVLVCTSGSALLNYFPAIAEAYYSRIPLIVLSADRPKHLVDNGDGQTINQSGVFQSHVCAEEDLILTDELEKNTINVDICKKVLSNCIAHSRPVHLNIPFDEPLYLTLPHYDIRLEDVKHEDKPVAKMVSDAFKQIWRQSSKKMILIGCMAPNTLSKEQIDHLANDPSIVVLTESTSNVHHPNFFNHIDQLISSFSVADSERFRPDLLVTMGGLVISKKIKTLFRQYQPESHWHIDQLEALDTYFCLKKHFKMSPDQFFEQVYAEKNNVDGSYKNWVRATHLDRLIQHEDYLTAIPFSDLKAFDLLFKSLPQNIQLQMGNSSTIRYMQLFQSDPSIDVYCNRGTSGIDGSLSTAIGAATVANKPVLCVLGDLSFFYDSNALWQDHTPTNFKIIVINNGGGGIFRILPGPKNTITYDRYFETTHQLTAKQLAKMHGFSYYSAKSAGSLKRKLRRLFKPCDKPMLLEIFTPRKQNDQILLQYFNHFKS